MMNKRIKAGIIIAVMILMTAMISVPSTLAYFTAYTRIKGTVSVVLNETCDFKEEKGKDPEDKDDDTYYDKIVTITAGEDSDPIFVRVRAFASSEIQERLEYVTKGEWTESDGWYVYNDVLYANDKAVMRILIDKINLDEETFNVSVVYEYIPAIVNENGEFVPDWNATWTGGGE